jgi:hypothetical protein
VKAIRDMKRGMVAMAGLLFVLASVVPALATSDSIVRVAGSGRDEAGCGSLALPCKTIQYALDHIVPGQEIRVAEGVYTYNPDTPKCSNTWGAPAVVCAKDPVFRLLGGYSTTNWDTPDPVAHPTIIDGQRTYRGVFLLGTGPTANLRIEGFTIRNGLARGIHTRTGDDGFYGYGGGMFVDLGYPPIASKRVELSKLRFENNLAWGEDHDPYGGSGVGGGLSLRSVVNAELTDLTFVGNEARGGNSTARGGYGIGGAAHTLHSDVTFVRVTALNNIARGGNSSGSGVWDGELGDGLGGGIATHGVTLRLHQVVAQGNRAIGGNARDRAGNAVAGGLFAEYATMLVEDSLVTGNYAIGGDGARGGLAGGGGVDAHQANLSLRRVQVVNNTAQGGNTTGNGTSGQPGGGGIYIVRFSGNTWVEIDNSIIAANTVVFGKGSTSVGGGGGGIWMQGAKANIRHSTIAGNRLLGTPLIGNALLAVNFDCATGTNVELAYSIIADHPDPGLGAAFIQTGSTGIFRRTLWSGNSLDTNLGGAYPGTILDYDPLRVSAVGFLAPTSPSFDYHLGPDSPARDQALGSSEELDVDREARYYGSAADLGADEYVPILFLHEPRPGDQKLTLHWTPNAATAAGAVSYSIHVTCPPGAKAPAEGSCNSPFNVGLTTSFTLTGLTNGAEYGLYVDALNGAGRSIAMSNTTTGTPDRYDHRLLLPAVFR